MKLVNARLVTHDVAGLAKFYERILGVTPSAAMTM